MISLKILPHFIDIPVRVIFVEVDLKRRKTFCFKTESTLKCILLYIFAIQLRCHHNIAWKILKRWQKKLLRISYFWSSFKKRTFTNENFCKTEPRRVADFATNTFFSGRQSFLFAFKTWNFHLHFKGEIIILSFLSDLFRWFEALRKHFLYSINLLKELMSNGYFKIQKQI